MKKEFKFFGIIWLAGIVLFNAITFLVPNVVFGVSRFDKPVFWISYALISISFVAQIIIAYKVFNNNDKEKVFLNIPLFRTGVVAIIVSLVVGLVFMIIPVIPAWIGAIVCLLVLGFFIIACMKAKAVAEIVSDVGEKVKIKTSFIRMAIVEAESILARATTDDIKSQTKRVYEALRYSDPVSNDLLKENEEEISAKLGDFRLAVVDNNETSAKDIASELLILIKERNVKCKALK